MTCSFNNANWRLIIDGVNRDVLFSVHRQALKISSQLPRKPKVDDLLKVEIDLAVFRSYVACLKLASARPELLPSYTIGDFELALWAMGIAHYLSREPKIIVG